MNVKKKSQIQEERVAEAFNAKTVVASGALWGSKGDVRTDKFLIECKTTDKGFYSLTKKVWDKIYQEANRDGMRIPLMCIDVQGKSYIVTHCLKELIRGRFDIYSCICHDTFVKSFRITKGMIPDDEYVYHIFTPNWEQENFYIMRFNDFMYELKEEYR